jgi:Ca2+-binding EF-hand superfamily protein
MALGFLQKYRARKVFSQLAGADRLIDLNEWQQALGLRNPLIARRLFQLVDTDDSGFIDEREYCEFLGKLLDTKSDQRYTLVFSLYDLDDAGVLDQRGIRRILQASLDEQSLQVSDADLSELASGFLRFFKSAGKRRLESADFVSGIRAYKNIDQLIKRFSDIWLPGNSKH